MKIVAFANTKLNNRTIRSRVVAGVVVAGFLTLGAAIRFAWLLFYDQFHIPPSEAFNLGAAFGKTGGACGRVGSCHGTQRASFAGNAGLGWDGLPLARCRDAGG